MLWTRPVSDTASWGESGHYLPDVLRMFVAGTSAAKPPKARRLTAAEVIFSLLACCDKSVDEHKIMSGLCFDTVDDRL